MKNSYISKLIVAVVLVSSLSSVASASIAVKQKPPLVEASVSSTDTGSFANWLDSFLKSIFG